MSDVLYVTEEEYAEEVTAQHYRMYRHEQFWVNLRRIVSNVRRTEQRVASLELRLDFMYQSLMKGLPGFRLDTYVRLRDRYLPQAQDNLRQWNFQREEIIKQIYSIRDEISKEAARIKRKVIFKPPPPKEKLIGNEECSGYDIYFNFDTEKYMVRDPSSKELIRIEDKICLELTASIHTSEGHEKPVTVEITCTTYVKQQDPPAIVKTEIRMNEGLRSYLYANAWDNLMDAFEKIGVAYNGEQHIEDRGLYTWQVPDVPKVHVFIEKKKPRKATYTGFFTIEEE